MRTRRIGAAFRPGSAAAARREAFPGLSMGGESKRGEAVRSGSISFLLHAAIIAALLLLAYLTPAIREEILPVQIIKEAAPPPPPPPPPAPKQEEEVKNVEPKPEPAPAPKALAERRSMDFAPQAQAVKPSIINPTVIQQAAPTVQAQKIQMNEVAAVVAPKDISHATVVAERVTAVASVATAQVSKVDLGAAAAPALRGDTNAALPAGASAGPRQVVAEGNTVGTGSAVNLGNGSSVREGIASNRDVLGVPNGAPLANVNTKVGTGFMHGDGGNGTSMDGGGSDCVSRPEVQNYLALVKDRVYARWNPPKDLPADVNYTVTMRFTLDESGSLVEAQLGNGNPALGQSAVEAMRASAPFAAMPDRVRCLARHGLTGLFKLPSAN
ncbi:MAG TPA: TonB C-terminal domain-containing protein [Myxococcota bacterium]|nr:TonB C-terminal domain-containing protein [Myxococcota bacterium]